MPAVNDLTPEEEAMFAQHGVSSAGQGGEPIREGQEEDLEGQQGQQTGDDEDFTQQQLNQQHEQNQEPKPGELGSRHRADGTFKTKEELEADQAALAAQQGGQQQGQQGQQGQQQQEPKFVPLAALHEARQVAAQARQREQLAMARLNALLTQQQGRGQQEQRPQMPNLAEDPVGYLQAMEARLAAFEQTRQEETQYRQIDNSLEQDEALFSQSVPDYDQASDYYVQSRAQELLQFYPPDEAQRIMVQEARAIAQQAWARGMSAAQSVYQLAQARGYRPGMMAQQGQSQGQPQHQNGNFQQQQRPNGQAQVEAVRRAQAASRSLSGGGGSANTDVLNAEALLQMSDEEFEKHLQLGSKGANQRFAQALG